MIAGYENLSYSSYGKEITICLLFITFSKVLEMLSNKFSCLNKHLQKLFCYLKVVDILSYVPF